MIGVFIFRNSHLLDRALDFSDRGSMMMLLALAAEVLLIYNLHRISTVKVNIGESTLKFNQANEVTVVNLNDIKSVKRRGAVNILVTAYGEKKVPHFGMFGELGLFREFESLGLLNNVTTK